MKKQFQSLTEKGRWLIATLTLIFTLGIGQMWADDYTFATGTFASDKLSATVDNQTFTFSFAHGGGGSNSYADGQGSKYIKIGSGKTMTITFPNGFVASNLNIKGYTNKDNKTNGEISEVAGVAQSGKTFPARNTGNVSEYDFSISSTATSITFKTQSSTEQSCLLITITGTPPACTQPTIAWDVEPAGGEVGNADFTASVTTTPENHAVTWSSSITSAATVNNGTIHYVAPGLPTIQASLTYTGEDYCNITVSTTKTILVPITTDATGTNDKYWYYTTEVPSGSSDNGLNYSGTKSGSGLYGTKLNDGGYAWFAKPAVAGTLRVGAFRADGQGEDYEVNVYACNNEGTKGDALGTLSTPHIGGVSTPMDIAADVAGIRIERKTSKEGVLYFVEFKAAAETAVCPSGLSISGTAAYDEGETISLEAALTAGNGEISYKWYKGSIAAGNEIGTGATFTKENCVPGDAGNYYCVAIKDGCDNAESNAYAVTVTPAVDCSSLAGTIYKFQIKTSGLTNGNLSESGTFDVTTSNYLASISGGTLQGYNENNKMTVYGNSSLQLSDNSKSYFIAELDCPLQAGDTIKSIVTGNTALVSKASSKTEDVKLQTSSNATTYNKVVIPTTNNLVDETKVYIWKGGGNCQMRYFEVIRPAKYAVTYTAGDGSVKEGQSLPTQAATVEGGKFNTALGTALEKSGYDFAGWQWTDDESNTHNIAANTEFTMPAYPVTFVAQWTLHVDKYTVKYMDGEDLLDSEEVTVGEHPAGITNPTKALYTFVNWKNGDDVVNPTELDGTADQVITLQAQWTKVYAQSVDFTTSTYIQNPRMTESLADVLVANNLNYACGGTFSSSQWAQSDEDAQYHGYKFKDKNVYIEFRVEANKRVTLLFGSYGATGTIKVGDADAVNCTLTDSKYIIDTDAEKVIRFTTNTGSGSTVTLKSITIGEIPALSDDATLSDLTLKYGTADAATISGFSSAKQTYYVEVPYGTAKADLPIVGATATDATNALVTINQAKDREDWKTVIRVQAEDRIDDHDKYYEVRFNVLPKLGVELIKVVVPAGTHNDTEATGYFGGTGDTKNEGNSLKIGGGCYAGVVLTTEKTFKAGDVINIHTSAVSTSGGSVIKIYADNSASTLLYNTETIGGDAAGNNFFVLPEAVNNVSSLYVVRTDDNKWNGSIDYIAVYRLMAPFIEEFKIGDAVGTIDGTNIAVEVPYSADLEHLTPAIKYWANGNAQISPAVAEKDFSSAVEYTVSSSYAEDATGAYAPVTYTVTVTKEAHYEAKIGETGYATLVAAVEAAQDGDVIVLQEDVTNGAGVMLTKTDAKEITIDFGGYTYTAVSPAVGSAGTQNQAFHLEKGNTVTLKNGTITSSGSEIKMLIQNYCDLTLENITLDGSGLEGAHRYVMSNNCGNVEIGDGTTITAKDGDVAFDVCATNYYPEGVTVTVKEGATISGIVEYDVWGTKPADNHAELAIEGGNFDVTWNVEAALAEDAKDNLNVSGGTFTAAVPADYCAEGYAPTNWTVGTETKYGVHLAGVIRAAAAQDANHGNAYAVTLDNGVVVISSTSDGKFDTNNQFDNGAADAAVALGADAGKYRYKGQHMLLKFPVNVNEFTIYSYDNNTTDRKISKVTVGTTPATEKLKNNDAIGTYTFTNNTTTKLRTMTATMTDDEIIASDKYVYVGLSNAHTVFRILYTEAPCIDPVINSIDATRMKVGEQATVSVDASAVGATYQWYRCEDALGANPQIIDGATAASYSFTKVAGDEYFKVVVGNNCNDVKVEAIVKAEEWFEVTRTNVTGYTEWNWNGIADTDNGPTINDSQKGLVLASYIDAPHFDKLEGVNGARVYRSNQYPAYQGTQLKFTTEVPGMLIIDASYQDNGNTFSVNGYPMGTLPKNHAKDTIAVKAGDVTITSQGIRIWAMTFDPDFSNYALTDNKASGYTRDVTEGRYGTICLENGGVMTGATLYEVAYYGETSKKIFFDEILNGTMEAGVPYIYLPNENATQLGVFYTDAAGEDAQSANGLVGYIGASEETSDAAPIPHNEGNYILNNNQYREVVYENSAYVLSHRAYIKLAAINPTEPALAPGRRRISMNVQQAEVATGMDNLYNGEQPMKVMIDGQMYILRGEKMYDATGRLVK